MAECTWVGCKNEAKNPQTARDGQVWANLCDTHFAEFSDSLLAVTTEGPKRLLSAWIRAQGGAKKAAARL